MDPLLLSHPAITPVILQQIVLKMSPGSLLKFKWSGSFGANTVEMFRGKEARKYEDILKARRELQREVDYEDEISLNGLRKLEAALQWGRNSERHRIGFRKGKRSINSLLILVRKNIRHLEVYNRDLAGEGSPFLEAINRDQ